MSDNASAMAQAMARDAADNGRSLLSVSFVAATLADKNHKGPRAMLESELGARHGVDLAPCDSRQWGQVSDLLMEWHDLGDRAKQRPSYVKVRPDGSTTLVGAMFNSWSPPR